VRRAAPSTVIVFDAQSVLSSRSYGDLDGDKRRQYQKESHARKSLGFSPSKLRREEMAPDTESDIFPDPEDSPDY
jgi:hypothetical protein